MGSLAKRLELSIGPGLFNSSPTPNWSHVSYPTYFFHCFSQRQSTRYLQIRQTITQQSPGSQNNNRFEIALHIGISKINQILNNCNKKICRLCVDNVSFNQNFFSKSPVIVKKSSQKTCRLTVGQLSAVCQLTVGQKTTARFCHKHGLPVGSQSPDSWSCVNNMSVTCR